MPHTVHDEASKATPQNKFLMSNKNTLSLTLLLFLFLPLLSSSQQITATISDCLKQRCGSGALNVRYPFALDDRSDCPAFSEFFRLHCNASTSMVSMNISTEDGIDAFDTRVQVTNITNDSLVINITRFSSKLPPASSNTSCDNVAGSLSQINLPSFPGPFVISNDNEFGSFGCGTYAIFITAKLVPDKSSIPPLGSPSQAPTLAPAPAPAANDVEGDYDITDVEYGGCVTASCQDENKNSLKCGNHGCCVSNLTSLKLALRYAAYTVADQRQLFSNMACAVGGGYSTFFHPQYTDFNKQTYQLLLKWALPSIDIQNSTNSACSAGSMNTTVGEVPGYLCSCRPGYTGDGYLNGSRCSDVDECALALDDCVSGSKCINVEGNYTCSCNGLFRAGDGRKRGSGCHLSYSIKLVFGISSASVVLAGLLCLAIWWKRRTKRKYFIQNGGLEMKQFLRARPGRERTRLFKADELKAATNNYAECMKIGTGGFGWVFKGVLADGRVVAIKKAKNMGSRDEAERHQFWNEMDILTNINHRHIVRLLGCCLETQVPLLVYEYVPNGNVAENLEAERGIMSWEQRLKVARQTAEALAYLHSAASPPILHRDVKSANVLLDENLDAKVADFGLSRLVPDGVDQVSTAVKGTIGYLDPEYFQSFQLSDKSDVYSLGVMLTELITGLKPVDSRSRETCFANLALLFIRRMQEGKLDELIDDRLSEVSSDATLRTYSSIVAVASLACQCLALEGSARPSMSHVAEELRHISQSLQAGADEDDDEATPLLFSGEEAIKHEVKRGAALLKESEYQTLHSGSMEDMLLSSTTLAR